VPVETTEISATPEEVWAVVGDVSRTAEWLAPIRTLEAGATGAPLAVGQSYKVAMNGRVPAASMMVRAVEVESRLRCTIGPGFAHPLGLAMRAEVSLRATETGTAVTVDLSCNPVTGRLQQRISGIDPGAAAGESVAQLKRLVEGS
jgi:uncharacterized protein YndB with AHSA1/START domain